MKTSGNSARNQHDENPYRSWPRRAEAVPLGRPFVVALLAALLGAVIGALIPPTYTAESRLAVDSTVDLTPHAVAGFPVSARAAADMYANLINENHGSEIFVPEDVTLEAIHLPQSNVLRLQARARTPEAAIAGATAAADAVIEKVNRFPTIEQQVAANAETAADAYADTAITGIQTEAARDAEAQLRTSRQLLIQEASRPTMQLRLIREAGSPVSDRVERVQALSGIGFVLGFLGAATLIPTQRRKGTAALQAAWRSDWAHIR